MTKVTQILSAIEQGDAQAAQNLLPLVYQELRNLAAQRLASERPGHTLQATALVHEAYLRLIQDEERTWENRAHFIGVAAHIMRLILIDYARRRQTALYRDRQSGRRCEIRNSGSSRDGVSRRADH